MATSRTTLLKVRGELTELPGRVVYGGERIIVTKHGKPVFAIVPVEDLNRLEVYEAREVLGKDGPTYTLEEVRARLGIQ